jgi:nicotinamide-nucleotide amidase
MTGVAGPDGGTPDKPVGTACLALAAADTTASRRYQLWGNREWMKTLTAQLLLDWVRRYLLGLPIAESGFIRR